MFSFFFFFKQKTAYEITYGDWSSDVCSSDLPGGPMIGLNLYDHPIADFALETAVVCAGWLVYRRSLPLEVRGTRLAWLFVLALVGIQLLGAFDLAFLPRV